MEKVYIARCNNYDIDNVKKSVYACMESFPELKKKLTKGARVLVKANLLMKKSPDEVTTTHPSVIEAIVRFVQDSGCKAIIGDSPGGPFTVKSLQAIYTATGMAEVAEKTGCELNYDITFSEVWDNNAKLLKSMKIINIAKQVDFIISAAKLKTHGMMTYTGAVKNLFGVVPGLTKAEYHFKMNNAENFAHHLIDICQHIKPAFSIIDGIDGMEGNGPSSGDRIHAGLVLGSTNPFALDTAAAHIIGMSTDAVPTIKAASERGVFSGKISDVDIMGAALQEINVKPFKLPHSADINFVRNRVPRFIEKAIVKALRPSPVFDLEKCVSCGDCKRSCPPDVIDMSSGKPVVDLSKCIRCFCCHELCPKKAVDIKRHWIHEKLFK
ncbi:MAG: DUF362 domain-containing protein [Bacillota bacterium]